MAAASGQRPWTPFDTTTESWGRPDVASTVTVSSGVQQVRDVKGTAGRNYDQGTTGNRPTITSNALNGRAALTFNGSQFLIFAGAQSITDILHNPTGGIFIALWRAGTTGNPNAIYALCGTNAASSSNVGFYIAYDDRSSRPVNDRLITQISRGVAGAASFNETADNAHLANTPTIITVINNPGAAAAADRSLIRINGNTAVQGNTLTNTASSATSTHQMMIGAAGNSAGPVIPLVGDIFEWLILPFAGISAAIDIAQRCEGYLASPAEWNQQSILAAGHPYKSAPPMI